MSQLIQTYSELRDQLIKRVQHMTSIFWEVAGFSDLGVISSTVDYDIDVQAFDEFVLVEWTYVDPYEEGFDEQHSHRFDIDFFENATDDELRAYAQSLADRELFGRVREDVKTALFHLVECPGLFEYVIEHAKKDMTPKDIQELADGYVEANADDIREVYN